MTNVNILDEAKSLVLGDRNSAYGPAWEDYGRTAKLWSIILNHEVTAAQSALCMVVVKLSRECFKHKRDNLVDMAGYAAVVQSIEEHKPDEDPQKEPGLIYLASPYSHPDESVRIDRFEKTRNKVSELVRSGLAVYSPIINSHVLTGSLPGDWGFWEKIDKKFLERCDELRVLMLPGWETSVGVKAEVEFAVGHNKPVIYC